MGGEDYLGQGICIIEWGEKIQQTLPKNYTKIDFQKSTQNDEERVLTISQIHS